MANIDPAPSWADIRQLETTDRNLAGPGGVLNSQSTSIAARLNLLRNNATALNNTVSGVSSRQDATDSAIASLQSQVIDAPGTLSDLDHGAPISVTGDQFPDVLSIGNSRGPILALNESIADLAQRDECLKNAARQANLQSLEAFKRANEAYWKVGKEIISFRETWGSGFSNWNPAQTTALQISQGAVYSTGAGGAASGINHAFPIGSNEVGKFLFSVNIAGTPGAGGGIIVGVNSDPAGASPSAGGANSFGIYRNGTQWMQMSNGTSTQIQNGVTNGRYLITVSIDEYWISITAKSQALTSEIRCRRPRAGFQVNNIYIFNSDGNALNGSSISQVGAINSFSPILPRDGLEDVAPSVHWTGNGTYNCKIETPVSPKSGNPTVLCFHGNGSDENVMSDNANQASVNNALLSAGYSVITATYIANRSTWGASVSIESYLAALKWFLNRYVIGDVYLYGNSMGGLESLIALSDYRFMAKAWAGTHSATNLRNNYENALFNSLIKTAYGVDESGTNYAEKTNGHDPMLIGSGMYKGTPMWVLYATDDAAVIQQYNTVLFVEKIKGFSPIEVNETTGGHSAPILPFVNSLVNFYNSN